MNETTITLQGWMGSEVSLRQAGAAEVAGFRLACTPRRLNRRTGEWADQPTQWYSVNAWRGLAENCQRSLRSGDPVVVHGRLNVSTWKNAEGVEMTTLEIDATFVGHDLNRGTSHFAKSPVRPAAVPDAAGDAPGEGGRGVETDEETDEVAA